jgi:oligopeptide transport system permease protein
MIPFLLKRFFWFCLTIWLVITISFALTRSVRGGPFDGDRELPPEIERNLKEKYHLDDPVLEQYGNYLAGLVFRFDLGPSLKMRDYSVNEIIAETLPRSALLGLLALSFALAGGLAAGITAAVCRGRALDGFVMVLATLGIAIPNFMIAFLLIFVFVFALPLFPAAGWGGLNHLILPALALGAPFGANIARLARSGMLEVLGEEYIRTARARGLRESRVILVHALRGAILPVISFLGPAAAGILTGSLVIEKIFAIPGMGDFFVNAALNRDHTLTMGIVIVYSILVYTINLLVDLAYTLIDPRIKL